MDKIIEIYIVTLIKHISFSPTSSAFKKYKYNNCDAITIKGGNKENRVPELSIYVMELLKNDRINLPCEVITIEETTHTHRFRSIKLRTRSKDNITGIINEIWERIDRHENT